MDLNVCRLCLSENNLTSMFKTTEQSESFTEILAVTTGLNITPNDGLPQQICSDCTELVQKAQKLRTQSHVANMKLQQNNFKQTEPENTTSSEFKNRIIIQTDDLSEEIAADCNDFQGFKIEVQMDRISQDGGVVNSEIALEESKQTDRKESRKEKRELYMSMVEGEFNPKGPLKCKICKKSVSKWVCFTSHAKKHLGFKVICEYCGKSFVSSNQLKRHSRSFHGLERELKCKYCSYLALDKAQLVVHERRQHTGERPYACAQCSAAYYSRKCLLQHIETHRTDASEQCDQCQARFKSRRHLSKHKYAAHTDKRRAARRERRRAQKQEENT